MGKKIQSNAPCKFATTIYNISLFWIAGTNSPSATNENYHTFCVLWTTKKHVTDANISYTFFCAWLKKNENCSFFPYLGLYFNSHSRVLRFPIPNLHIKRGFAVQHGPGGRRRQIGVFLWHYLDSTIMPHLIIFGFPIPNSHIMRVIVGPECWKPHHSTTHH